MSTSLTQKTEELNKLAKSMKINSYLKPETKILNVIRLFTYYSKRRLYISDLTELVGMSYPNVHRTLKRLKDIRKLISVKKETKSGKAYVTSIKKVLPSTSIKKRAADLIEKIEEYRKYEKEVAAELVKKLDAEKPQPEL